MAEKVRCPICGKQVALNDPNMPFCSDRCRLIDLGNWASDKYVIPTAGGANEIIDDAEPEGNEGPNQ